MLKQRLVTALLLATAVGACDDSLYAVIGSRYAYAVGFGVPTNTVHLNLRGHNCPDRFPFFNLSHITIDNMAAAGPPDGCNQQEKNDVLVWARRGVVYWICTGMGFVWIITNDQREKLLKVGLKIAPKKERVFWT